MGRLRRRLICAAAAAVLVLTPPAAAAATFHVGGAGASDSNDGSQEHPWATVTKALSAPDGSLVLVAPGDYPKLAPAGAVEHTAAPVTIRRAGYSSTDDPRALPAAGKVNIGSLTDGGSSLPVLRGLIFEGLHFGSSLTFNGADGLTITKSEIGPTQQHGLIFVPDSSASYSVRDTTISDNWFHDSNQDQIGGATGTHGTMIGILAPAPSSQGNVNLAITGNRFEGILDGDAMQLSGADGVTIDRNQILSGKVGVNNDHVDSIQVLAPVTHLTISRNLIGTGVLNDDIRGPILQQKSHYVCTPPDTGPDCFQEFYSGPLGHIAIENNVVIGHDFSLRLLETFDSRVLHNTFWPPREDTGKSDVNGVLIWPTRADDPVQDEQLVLANNIMSDLTVLAGVTFATRGANIVTYPHSAAVAGEFYGSAFTPLFAPGGVALSANDTRAKDHGLTGLGVTADFAGRTRDAKPDIGAYEAPALPAPPPHVAKKLTIPPPVPGLAALSLPRLITLRHKRTFVLAVRCRIAAGCKRVRLVAVARIHRRRAAFSITLPALRNAQRKRVKVTLGRRTFARLRHAGRVRFRIAGPGSDFRARHLVLHRR